jgi:CRISPR-associated exonuclease Cas4
MGVSLGLALLLLAVLAWIWSIRLRSSTGLPWAPVLYQDTRGRALEKPLFARRLGLTGKPDYLLEVSGRTIPVEVKPGRRAALPYESDLMQLAAYCLLIEETSGKAPPYGLLRYADRTFRLNYTPQVRDDLLALLDEMRAAMQEQDCARSHDDRRRCRGCGFFEQCDEALGDEGVRIEDRG